MASGHPLDPQRTTFGASAAPERKPDAPSDSDRFFERVALAFRRRWESPDAETRRVTRRTIARGGRLRTFDDAALLAEARRLRTRLAAEGFTSRTAPLAFALAREATRREFGFAHHRVQIVGGWTVLSGGIAEMATGEGKTITALLPAAAAALAGLPAHVITVNDYLAERDAHELGPIYARLGLSVGLVKGGMEPPQRAAAYACDVTYVTNKEIVFDYLRDRMALRGANGRAQVALGRIDQAAARKELLLRGLAFCVVDEADSVLIDEVRTPLIISMPAAEEARIDYAGVLAVVAEFLQGRDFFMGPDGRAAELSEAGRARTELFLAALPPAWRGMRARCDLALQALSALHLFKRDIHYIIAEGKAKIVDESTGRIMGDRQWERGLQQLIEAKEQIELSDRRITAARITYQSFFSRYLRIGGMTGTGKEVGRELTLVYGTPVVGIPTHRAPRRRRLGVRLYGSSEAKAKAVARRAARIAKLGRPVLVGARSVKESERLAEAFAAAGVPHVILNARHDADEAEVVARAGEPGRITIATSMAGRGTDIKLAAESRARGGLHVILTEFHESARIDRQFEGRSARQGDPGSCEAIVSLEDSIFNEHAPRLTSLMKIAAAGRRGRAPGMFAKLLRLAAQGRAEWRALRARRATLAAGRELDRALAFSSSAD